MRYWVLIGLAMTLALARGQTVEFPLGYYSYAEIAQRMSVGGRRVVCAPELNDSMTLLRLKPREWGAMRRVLENTLEVQFRPTGDNRWILARPPEVLKQDARLLEALAHALEQDLLAQRAVLQRIIQSNTPAETLTMESAARLFGVRFSSNPDLARYQYERLRERVALLQSAPFLELRAHWRAISRFRKALADEFPRAEVQTSPLPRVQPPAPLSHRVAIERFLAKYSLGDFGLPPSLLRMAEQHARLSQAEWEAIYPNIWFDAAEYRAVWALDKQCALALEALRTYAQHTLLQQLTPPPSLQQAFEQGGVAQVYTLSVDAETLALLFNDSEGAPVAPSARATTPLTLLATAWWDKTLDGYRMARRYLLLGYEDRPWIARTFDEEAVFTLSREELSRLFRHAAPARARQFQQALQRHESLLQERALRQFPPRAGDLSHTLYERLAEWAGQQDQEVAVELAMTWDVCIITWGTALRLYVADDVPLHTALREHTRYAEALLDRYETVWTLRNFAAFWNRLQRVPAAPIRRLIVSDGSPADWKGFYRSLSPVQAARLATSSEYIPEWLRAGKTLVLDAQSANDYGEAWLILHFLEQLPSEQRDRLLKAPAWADVIRVPLGSLPAPAKARLAEVLRLWATTQLAAKDFYVSRRDEQLWYDLLTGQLPMERLLSGLVLERRHGGWELSYHAPEVEQHSGVLLLMNGLPANRRLLWVPDAFE